MYGGKGAAFIYKPVRDAAFFNIHLQILTSPGVLRRVVKTLDLEHNQAFLQPQTSQPHSTWKTITGMLGFGGAEQKPVANQAKQLPLTTSLAPATSIEHLAEAKRLAPYVNALQPLKGEP